MKESTTRRQFIGASSALISGLVLSSNKILSAPAYIRDLTNNKSFINGVQIGVITYSFREMPDQSAEATLKYILDSGVNAVELMGGPAESFAGAPKNPVNINLFYPLLRKRYEKKEMS